MFSNDEIFENRGRKSKYMFAGLEPDTSYLLPIPKDCETEDEVKSFRAKVSDALCTWKKNNGVQHWKTAVRLMRDNKNVKVFRIK